jgi:hypothetical protein
MAPCIAGVHDGPRRNRHYQGATGRAHKEAAGRSELAFAVSTIFSEVTAANTHSLVEE